MSVQGQPEKPLIGQILRGGTVAAAVLALKDPMRVAGRRVDFVPPSQPDEAPAGDVFEIIKIGGKEEDGEDED